MGRPLTLQELSEVSGGDRVIAVGTRQVPGVTPVYDLTAIRELGMAMDMTQTLNQLVHNGHGYQSPFGADDDGDGVINPNDLATNGDDKAYHVHLEDGDLLVANPDGTFSLFDENGTKMPGHFVLDTFSTSTGGTDASESGFGMNVGPGGVGAESNFSISTTVDGDTRTYVYVPPGG